MTILNFGLFSFLLQQAIPKSTNHILIWTVSYETIINCSEETKHDTPFYEVTSNRVNCTIDNLSLIIYPLLHFDMFTIWFRGTLLHTNCMTNVMHDCNEFVILSRKQETTACVKLLHEDSTQMLHYTLYNTSEYETNPNLEGVQNKKSICN